MYTIKQQYLNLILTFSKRQVLVYAVLNRKISRTNVAIDFTFQTTSKAFIN
ncbi:MAG: hypothetical protein V4541_13665 [Bacteroidota bacterium]